MTDTNETVLRRLFRDVWNSERPESAKQFVHEEYLIHDRDLAEELRGPQLYQSLASVTREIFPDMEFTIEDTVASDDRVALRWTMRGTHDGPLFGIEPTGTQIKMSAIEINRFEDGKLIETWTQSDQLGLMKQVGALRSNE